MPMRATHRIRTRDNSTREVTTGRAQAIKLFCTECMGFEAHPKDCTSTLCPLYPYRGKTLAAHHGDSHNAQEGPQRSPESTNATQDES